MKGWPSRKEGLVQVSDGAGKQSLQLRTHHHHLVALGSSVEVEALGRSSLASRQQYEAFRQKSQNVQERSTGWQIAGMTKSLHAD